MAEERQAAELTDRVIERHAIDRFVGAVRAGQSQALVVHGEAGVGKTALLEYLAGQAAGCRVRGLRGSSRRWSWRSRDCIS